LIATTMYLLLVLLCLLLSALANTEIRNFEATEDRIDEIAFLSLKFKELDWKGLDANASERDFHVVPAKLGTALDQICETSSDASESISSRRCAHESWVRLELDDKAWSTFTRFTLRVSWPAFYSTDFDLKIFSASELLQSFASDPLIPRPESWAAGPSRTTRRMYARIRLVDTGVRNPSHPLLDAVSDTVPFIVKLEPLHLGVLPESVIPTILAILLVAGASALFVVPKILSAFERIGLKAAEELSSEKSAKKTQ